MSLFLILPLILILIVVAIAYFKIHPFLTLIIAAVMSGFALNLDGALILNTVSQGFGNTLSSIGIIIAFGSVIGTFLEKSGATRRLAQTLINVIGSGKSPLALNFTGLLIAIPVFCDSGFIILSSLNKALRKKTGISIVVFAVALSTGLYVSHVFIPPTPGPLAAATALNADLGLVILVGLFVAIPTAVVGYLWALRFKHLDTQNLEANDTELTEPQYSKQPLIGIISPIIIPIGLIALKSIASYPTKPFGDGVVVDILLFLGHPLVALFIGIVCTVNLIDKDITSNKRLLWVTESLKEAGVIILITGAGGAFGAVLRSANIDTLLATHMTDVQVGVFLPFLLAAILKTAQGSSTVAIITSATIIAPLLPPLGLDTELSKALTVLAIGAGAMTVSHINDSYFWVVSQFSGMTTKTTLKSHTLATGIQGITAIILIFILQTIFN